MARDRIKTLIRRLVGQRSRSAEARLSDEKLRREIARFGTWTYPFQLSEKLVTPVHQEWLRSVHATRVQMIFPRLDQLFGQRWPKTSCLDVACNEGFFALEVGRRGAVRVLGFDARPVNIEKAEFMRRHYGLENVTFQIADLAELSPERFGNFDVTLCLGVLYHLEDPMGAIRKVCTVTRKLCVIDTQVARETPPATVAWITAENLRQCPHTLAVVDEPDATWNPAASVTGVSLVPTLSTLLYMLEKAGFRSVELLEPVQDCFPAYASQDRVILLAWR